MTKSSQKNSIPFSVKLGIIALIIASTLGYSMLKKRQVDELTSNTSSVILDHLPDFTFNRVSGSSNKEPITDDNVFDDGSKAILVHFWGTWCAPCEAELPEFIEFARSYEGTGLKAIMLAVQDDDKKIRKFLKRFGDLPSNIELVHDKKGDSRYTFGTVKVPETYLFSSTGKNLNKFVGPQSWGQQSIRKRVDFYLNSLNGQPEKKKIETH